MRCEYKTQGVCSTQITFDLEGNVVRNISFTRGCDGNLKALGRVLDGKTVEEIEALFSGLTCGGKPTSCSDQLAKAVRASYDAQQGK